MEVNLILGRKYQKYSDNSMPLCSVIDSKAGIRGEERLDGSRVYGTYIVVFSCYMHSVCYQQSFSKGKCYSLARNTKRGGQERMEKYQEGNNAVGFR